MLITPPPVVLCFEPNAERFTALHRGLNRKYQLVWVSAMERLSETMHAWGPKVAAAIVSANDGAVVATRVVQRLSDVGVPSLALCPSPSSEKAMQRVARRSLVGPVDGASVSLALGLMSPACA